MDGWSFVLVLLINLVATRVESSLEYEKVLHRNLTFGYIKDVRPESEHDRPLEVEFSLVLQGISELDIRKQVLTVNAFTTLRWNDPQLRWNASDYDGITKCVMSPKFVWTPDVVLYNTADDRPLHHTELYRTKVKIRNTGEVSWTAPTVWMVSCPCKVAWFPFDEQICRMNFGSWTNEKSLLTLRMDERLQNKKHVLGGAFLVGSGEWTVTSIHSQLRDSIFRCCDEPYSTISVELHLSRMARYYVIYILLPLFALVLVFSLVFHLDIGQRASYGVTILLSITVYLLVISDKLPEKSDEFPFIGISFIVDFCILCAFLPAAEYTAHLYLRSSTPPPLWLSQLEQWYYKTRKFEIYGTVNDTKEQNLELHENTEIDHRPRDSYEEDWRRCARVLDVMLTIFFLFIQLLFLITYLAVGYQKQGHL